MPDVVGRVHMLVNHTRGVPHPLGDVSAFAGVDQPPQGVVAKLSIDAWPSEGRGERGWLALTSIDPTPPHREARFMTWWRAPGKSSRGERAIAIS